MIYDSSRARRKRFTASSVSWNAVCESRELRLYCGTRSRRHVLRGNHHGNRPWNHSARGPRHRETHCARVFPREGTGIQPHHSVHHVEGRSVHLDLDLSGGTRNPSALRRGLGRKYGVCQTTLGFPLIEQRQASEYDRRIEAPRQIGSQAHNVDRRSMHLDLDLSENTRNPSALRRAL